MQMQNKISFLGNKKLVIQIWRLVGQNYKKFPLVTLMSKIKIILKFKRDLWEKKLGGMASTGSSSSVAEEVTQGTSMTTREELADDDIQDQDDDGSSCYQVTDPFKDYYSQIP